MNITNFLFFNGTPKPLGAKIGKDGVNFSVFSKNATEITLHFFETANSERPFFSYKLDPIQNKTGDIWHVFVQGATKDCLYLYTAAGPNIPNEGIIFNKNNFLLDPYAKQITDNSVFSSMQAKKTSGIDGIMKSPTAEGFPKSIVIDDAEFDWQGDRPLNLPLNECVIYEAHTKGFTIQNLNIDENKRGTYLGLIEEIPYLKTLGITSLELLPLFEFDENENININPITQEKLKNYWGYSTVAFFSPKASFASNPQKAVEEFKLMVREFHKAGIEIILDVVFNHTAEGNEKGPVFSFKGFDNSIYYYLEANKKFYRNYSGCGNTLNASRTVTRNFIMDCLKYWVTEMHVDGFRFDLAPILARDKAGNIDVNSPLLKSIVEDPILSATKIIAEPWDAAGGYMVGQFPDRWAEWNDKYRDGLRKFWLHPISDIKDLASRLTGSSDIYGYASSKTINYVSCHDGFTLYDTLSYNKKYNEVNGEENRDGNNNNWSFNHGMEGPAEAKIEKLRHKTAKNILTCLLLSVGTPMLNMGDEVLRTQHGNNNVYCQDNPISWFNWELTEKNKEIFEFTKNLINLRKKYFSFNLDNREIIWFDSLKKSPNWHLQSKFLAFLIDRNSKHLDSQKDDGKKDFFVIINSYDYDVTVKVPDTPTDGYWYRLIDTSYPADSCFSDETNIQKIKNQKIYISLRKSIAVLISMPN